MSSEPTRHIVRVTTTLPGSGWRPWRPPKPDPRDTPLHEICTRLESGLPIVLNGEEYLGPVDIDAQMPESVNRLLSPPPPRFVERLLLSILPGKRTEEILGDMEEKFHKIGKKHGDRFARWNYRQHALREILPYAIRVGLTFSIIRKLLG